jgi:uncharacterized protein YjbI with pentapeptide repeats
MTGKELLRRYATGERDFSGLDLRKADLSEADLRGINLRGADLRGADLRESNLRFADFRGANLEGAYVAKAFIADTDWRGANVKKINRVTVISRANVFYFTASEKAVKITKTEVTRNHPAPIGGIKFDFLEKTGNKLTANGFVVAKTEADAIKILMDVFSASIKPNFRSH